MEIAQNFDKMMPKIMPFESAKNSLLLPSPDFTKNIFTKLSPFCFFAGNFAFASCLRNSKYNHYGTE